MDPVAAAGSEPLLSPAELAVLLPGAQNGDSFASNR
jgi:hypothetical protein